MATHDNRAIVTSFIEAYNRGDVEGNIQYTAPECTLNGQPLGREGDRQRLSVMLAAFPGGRYSMEDIIAEGDRVVLRWIFSGIHEGDLMGIPPTRKQVVMPGISIYRFSDGMVTDIWEYYDRYSVLQQLGVIPAPA